MTTTATCRRAGDNHPRLTRAHRTDCDTASCPGCEPCPERHCRVCNHTHVTVDGRGYDQTCASCIADLRAAITRIIDLTAVMTTAATERGVNSLAALHAGPASNVEAHRHVHRSMATGRLCRCRSARGRQCPATLPPASGPVCPSSDDSGKPCVHGSCDRIRGQLCPDVIAWHEDVRDELHPLWVIGTWDFTVRDHLDQILATIGERLDLTTAGAYLNSHLTHLAHDTTFDFDQMHTEITHCRTHLEEVLAVAPYTETGAPCPHCGRGNLEKTYGTTETNDRWTCPKCNQWWTEKDYRDRVANDYLQHADRLTASQIRAQYRVPESTTRRWASGWTDRHGTHHDPVVARRGYDGNRRQLYDVPDVLRQRDITTPESEVV